MTFSFVSMVQRVEINEIFNNTYDVLEEKNSTIYIATDEHNKTFFDLLRKHYKIYFMDDFKLHLVGEFLSAPTCLHFWDILIVSKDTILRTTRPKTRAGSDQQLL